MVFKVLFRRTDAVLFENKYEWLPIEANNRNEAIYIFNKFLGNPFNYLLVDVSVLEY